MNTIDLTASALLPAITDVVHKAQTNHNWGGIGEVRTTIAHVVNASGVPQEYVVEALTVYPKEFAVAINEGFPSENILTEPVIVGNNIVVSVLRLTTDIGKSFPYI